MTPSQKLALKLSESRSRLSELAMRDMAELDGDDLAAARAELRQAQERHQDLEARYRAALVADDAKRAEVRSELGPAAPLSDFVNAAAAGTDPVGAAAEWCEEAFGQTRSASGGILIPAERVYHEELRADAVTTVSDALASGSGQVTARPIAARVFPERGAASALGADPEAVPYGTTELLLFSAGGTASMQSEKAAHDAAVADINPTTVNTSRLVARYAWTVEATAKAGPRLEAALTADLREQMADQLEAQIIAGEGTAPNIDGYLNSLTAPTAATAAVTFASAHSELLAMVDGTYASELADLSAVVGTATYRKLAATFYGTENPIDAWSWLRERLAALVSSAKVTAPASDDQNYIVRRGNRSDDSFVGMWPAVEAIRDNVTGAAKGEVALTFTQLYGAAVPFRADAYKLGQFQLA